MKRQYREAKMSPVVCAWLRGLGYTPYAEVPLWGSASNIDHVGVRWSDNSIICVEMKCSFTRKVFQQAYLRQLATPLVYIAVPCRPRTTSIEQAKQAGLGVFAGGAVILEPSQSRRNTFENYSRSILDWCRDAQEGGVGGMPTIAGDGPAIRVAAAVDAYRLKNPNAKWKQIFKDVPNHYSSPRSMAGALPFARGRKQRADALTNMEGD
jgi:hypothetical protein